MTAINVSGQMAMVIGISDLRNLQDPDTKENLKFEIDNHDAVHEGAFPVYKATAKDGRVYTAETRGDVRVFAGPKPDPYEKQKEKSEDRNMFKEGKQTPDKFAKTDKEEGLDDKIKGIFSEKKKK